ncbi:MAG: sensor histidine kinase, partial [Candidatus Saccharimonadales bacterium]
VHELRNPLTMLRGYIEVLEEEVDDKSNLEFTTDLQKMRASAQLLAEYTNNILNVSRVDSDQLNLHLRSEDWSALVSRVTESMILRARVHGMEIKTNIAPNLPPAGVDSVSISEVLMNLIDNAIKYGAKTKTITISSNLNQSGEIETTVNDRGSVIDSAVIGNLFQRFYRSHRTRSQANGTGLGLYLSKALVEAHGGNIWISSNENEGTTAGFTVLPYTRIADEHKSENGNDIVRVPHGWIKNHSLYRR